jgi:hypothetical protein
MGFGSGITGLGETGAAVSGTVDATLAANLPPLADAATYRVTVAGTFEASALIEPAGFYFDVGDLIIGNTATNKWLAVDANDPVSDTAYDATTWNGVTRMAPSKNAVRDILDTTFTATGLNANGTMPTFSGTNYMDAKTSHHAAIIEADSKIKSESIKYAIALGD